MRSVFVALALLVLAVPAGASSRLYPYVGGIVRFVADSHEAPRRLTLAQAGVAYSLGQFAPSLTARAGAGHAELEVGLRYSFR